MIGGAIISSVAKFFLGGGAKGLAAEWRKARKDSLDAQNSAERLAAEERMDQIAARLEAQTRSEASWVPVIIRALWALPFILYLYKLIVYDKLMGMGATDPLGEYELFVGRLVLSFYFLDAFIQNRVK